MQQLPYNKSPQLLRAAALSQSSQCGSNHPERKTDRDTDGRTPPARLWKYKLAPTAQGGDLRRYGGKIDVE